MTAVAPRYDEPALDGAAPCEPSAPELLARARRLRAIARRANPVVAAAYRRRAAELTLRAWVTEVRTGPVEVDAVLKAREAHKILTRTR